MSTSNSADYYMGMLYTNNDIFVTGIKGYDRLKFSQISTSPQMKSWVRQ